MTDAIPQEKNARRLYYAVKRRVDLVKVIAVRGPTGGVLCGICGDEHPADRMEVDHVDKITWDCRRMSPQMRAARYWREHKAGVKLRAACPRCNAADGGRRRWRRY